MPLFFSYLLKKYFRIFILSTFGFVSLLMATKLQYIAHFSALSSSIKNTLLFILLQVPHILSLAIPISSLIASFSLFRFLSASSEITVFRCCKMNLFSLFSPVFLAAFFLFLSHFYICSELSTYCKHKSREMIVKNTTANPLILLKRQKLLSIPKSYVDYTLSDDGKEATNMTLVFKNPETRGLFLLSSKKMFLENQNLIGEKCSFVSTFSSEKEGFDKIILENQESLTCYAPEISSFMKTSKERMNGASLPLRLLLLDSQKKGSSLFFIKEFARRLSLAFSVLSFTFIGFCFSLFSSRTTTYKKNLYLISLVSFFFLSYFLAKALKGTPVISISLLILPHLVLFFFGKKNLSSFEKGTT